MNPVVANFAFLARAFRATAGLALAFGSLLPATFAGTAARALESQSGSGAVDAASCCAVDENVATIDLGHGVTMDFVLIPAGSFIMGSGEESGDGDESPAHKVTLTEPFYLGKYEVTQEQWEVVAGGNPSHFKGPKLPVESVSWNDCQRFLAALRKNTGRDFSLPTEAQWEYACRAGTATRWSFGDDDSVLGDYAWAGANSGGTTHPVGGKKPNAWGLYDMHGNVGEWTSDWYAKHAYASGDVTDPHQPQTSGHSPIWRGGAWGDNPDYLRSAYRNVNGVDNAHPGIGLRCVLRPAATVSSAKAASFSPGATSAVFTAKIP